MLKRSRLAQPLSLLLGFALVLAACAWDSSLDEDGNPVEAADSASTGGSEDHCAEGTINISGSSTVKPVSARAAELYEDTCGTNIQITVDGPGTGDGFKLFCAGEIDIADASRKIKDKEILACKDAGVSFTEIRVAFDGIAVMTNPNNPLECLSFADLYALLGGESEGFETWADASGIASELGSSTELPDADLVISAPGTESGTYDSMVEIVLEHLAEERQGEGAKLIREDFAGNADDNVIIEGIAGSDTSLGWVGFAFASANQDRVRSMGISELPGGDCVKPSIESIANGTYPVSRSLYIYINNGRIGANRALVGYVDSYLGDGYSEAVSKAFGDSGYVELPTDQKTAADDAWAAAKG